MNFYQFDQNNSGGHFDVDNKLCHRVFIEAESLRVACAKFEDLGGYFDGCSDGRDCSCCGDRWHEPWDEVKLPMVYGTFPEDNAKAMAEHYKAESRLSEKKAPAWEVVFTTIDQYARFLSDQYGWTSPDARIYYADGRVVEIFSEKVESRKKKA